MEGEQISGSQVKKLIKKNQFAIPFITILWPLDEQYTYGLQSMWLMETPVRFPINSLFLKSNQRIESFYDDLKDNSSFYIWLLYLIPLKIQQES